MDKDESLTIKEAAKLLFVSPAHFRTLLQKSDLAAIQETPESDVRVLRSAVLEYKEQMRARQKAGLKEMMDASERLGLYDQEIEGPPNHKKD
ncbi:helix-turn-helix domain-containing protein [Paraburkholderia sp. BL6669N2]|uniref:helix-turn-helix domain-containing protein n=1 Tax=Paraburkholderia sp. BL6669N2 TaxID=1938807 RepID=UPI0011C03D99|nr:helix-turn-helix domain-containing protein [Paraburkholderia sp. BL6669N2]